MLLAALALKFTREVPAASSILIPTVFNFHNKQSNKLSGNWLEILLK
jgi:hypothetical protein